MPSSARFVLYQNRWAGSFFNKTRLLRRMASSVLLVGPFHKLLVGPHSPGEWRVHGGGVKRTRRGGGRRTSRRAAAALDLMPWFVLRIVPSGHCVDRNGQCHVDSRRLVVSTSYMNMIRFINPNSPHMDIAMANGGDAGESDVGWHLNERHKYVRDRRRHRSGGRGFDSRSGYPHRERLSAERELADERAACAVAARELAKP